MLSWEKLYQAHCCTKCDEPTWSLVTWVINRLTFSLLSCVCWLLWITLLGTLVNTYVFEILLSVVLVIYSEVLSLDHMVLLFLISWGNTILFSIVAAPLYILTNSAWGSNFSRSSPTIVIFYFGLIAVTPVGTRWYLLEVLIWISTIVFLNPYFHYL